MSNEVLAIAGDTELAALVAIAVIVGLIFFVISVARVGFWRTLFPLTPPPSGKSVVSAYPAPHAGHTDNVSVWDNGTVEHTCPDGHTWRR